MRPPSPPSSLAARAADARPSPQRPADSKTLTDPLREELFKDMLEHADDVKYAATVMSPADISMGMLRKTPYNLCVDRSAGPCAYSASLADDAHVLHGRGAQERAEPRRDDQPHPRGRRARVPRQGGASARPLSLAVRCEHCLTPCSFVVWYVELTHTVRARSATSTRSARRPTTSSSSKASSRPSRSPSRPRPTPCSRSSRPRRSSQR